VTALTAMGTLEGSTLRFATGTAGPDMALRVWEMPLALPRLEPYGGGSVEEETIRMATEGGVTMLLPGGKKTFGGGIDSICYVGGNRLVLGCRNAMFQVWKLGTTPIHKHGVEPICLHRCPVDRSSPKDGGAVWCVVPTENGRVLTAGADRRITRWS